MSARFSPGTACDPAARLAERARRLARPIAEATGGATLDVLEFTIAGERYAAEARYLREVHRPRELARLPCVPAFVAGIVNVRGRLLTVIDIRKYFGLADRDLPDPAAVVVAAGPDLELGLVADSIEGLRTLGEAELMPAAAGGEIIPRRCLRGITADGWVVLDLAALLSDPGLVVHDEIDGS